MELMHQEAAISKGEDLLEEEEELANHNKQIRFQDEAPPRKPLHHLMDLSLGNSNEQDDVVLANSATTSGGNNAAAVDPAVEKEHMFDKVVTPSDVGKLNRLVIPKQHAERYFPLDASTNDKGLLLNFEDRGGKLWRFRYSYWNSSQSYVMTKGWSRFVKEKKLDAGDIVSFHRGLGEMYRHRLYIDWRRRPDHVPMPNNHHHPVPASSLISPFFVPNQYTIRWGGGGDGSSGRMYSVPTVAPPAPMNYNNYGFQEPQLLLQHQHQYQQQQQRQYQQVYGGNGYNVNNEMNLGSGSLYYLRSTAPGQRDGGSDMAPMIIDSVPVAHGMSSGSGGGSNNAGKRLRLFGVNMECSSPPSSSSNYIANSSLPSRNPRESNEEQEEELEEYEDEPIGSSPSSGSRFGDEIPKGETSVLFDLNPSSFHQYRR